MMEKIKPLRKSQFAPDDMPEREHKHGPHLPLSGPVLASLGVLKFTGTWNEYMWPLVMTSGEELRTVQIALTMFRDESEIKWNLLMAATIVGSLPIYTVFFFAQKHFVSGLLAGSVKG